MYNLEQAEAKRVKNSGVEAAVEKKQRWEGLAEEVVFLAEKQWHWVAGGAVCWEVELGKDDQDRGVWKWIGVVGWEAEGAKSWTKATEVVGGHGWVVKDLWGDWD